MAKSTRIACDACGRDITLEVEGGYRLRLEIEAIYTARSDAWVRMPQPHEFYFCDPACLRDGLDREHPERPGRRMIVLPRPEERQP